jgi:hypothetical protein
MPRPSFRCRRRPWSGLLLVVVALILALTSSMLLYDWRPAALDRISFPPPRPAPANATFLTALRAVLAEQFAVYHSECASSDWARPLTHACRNYTGASETALAALAAFHLLAPGDVPPVFGAAPAFRARTGVEIGRVADYVVAPLISAYLVSDSPAYLALAQQIGEELLGLYNNSLFAPFIGVETGQFGTRDVLMESISSIYPVFASLALYTNNTKFTRPVKKFIDVLNMSVTKNQIPNKYSLKGTFKGTHSAVLDVPWRIYSDIARIRKILPQLKTTPLLNLIYYHLSESNPLKYYDVNEVYLYSIQPCSVGAYLPTDHKIFPILLKKCLNLVKRNPLPSRLNGASEFGTYDLETGFAFEGELLELFWRAGEHQTARSMILDSLKVCRIGSAVTGMVNATVEGRMTDNFIHPELFSRWVFNGALMDAGVRFDDLVLSEGGHILKKPQGLKIAL